MQLNLQMKGTTNGWNTIQIIFKEHLLTLIKFVSKNSKLNKALGLVITVKIQRLSLNEFNKS